MDEFLTKLRNKSDAEKRRIVLFTSLGLTAIIAVFWIVSLRVTGDWSTSQKDTTSAASLATASSTSPFSTLDASFGAIGSAFSEMGTSFEGLFSSTTK